MSIYHFLSRLYRSSQYGVSIFKSTQITAYATRSSSAATQSKKNKIIKPRFRPGDWICPQCQFHNHAHRKNCGECSHQVDSTLRQVKGGDWVCAYCQYYNFRQRMSCKQCHELRLPTNILQRCR